MRTTHSSWPTVPLQWRRAHLADAPEYRSTGLRRLLGPAVLYWSEFFFRLIWFNCQTAKFGPNYLVMLGMNLSSLTPPKPPQSHQGRPDKYQTCLISMMSFHDSQWERYPGAMLPSNAKQPLPLRLTLLAYYCWQMKEVLRRSLWNDNLDDIL